jgi:hypothetical protein
MARKKEYRIEFENQQTREKMNFIASSHPEKTPQQIIDLAVDCLFKAESENIQKNLDRLIGKEQITDEKK